MTVLAELLALAGAVASAFIALPQAVHAVRRTSAGVSSTTFQLALSVGVTWTAYGFTQGMVLLTIGNAVLAVSTLVVLWALHRDGTRVRQLVQVFVPMLAISALVAAIEPTWLAWLGGATSFALRFPQMRLVRMAPSIAGLSLHTWFVSLTSMACWILYGLLVDDHRLVIVNSVNACTTLSLIAATLARRRRERDRTDWSNVPAA